MNESATLSPRSHQRVRQACAALSEWRAALLQRLLQPRHTDAPISRCIETLPAARCRKEVSGPAHMCTKARRRTARRQNDFFATAACGRTRWKTQEVDLINDDGEQSRQPGKFSNAPNIYPRPQLAVTAAFSSSHFPLF